MDWTLVIKLFVVVLISANLGVSLNNDNNSASRGWAVALILSFFNFFDFFNGVN